MSGSSQRLTHKKEAPGDLLCMQLDLHVNKKSDYDMGLVATKPVFGVSEKASFKQAFSVTETS